MVDLGTKGGGGGRTSGSPSGPDACAGRIWPGPPGRSPPRVGSNRQAGGRAGAGAGAEEGAARAVWGGGAEWSRRTYPAPLGAGGVGSIPANSDAQNVPSFRRWRFEMKLSPFFWGGGAGAWTEGPVVTVTAVD